MFTSQDFDLSDDSRSRPIPVRLWEPTETARGWVLFSVGFGGDKEGYGYLAKAWAKRGIATAVVEHVGSNLKVLKELPGSTRQERNQQVVKRVGDPQELSARPRDLLFVWNQLLSRFHGLPLGVGGHSYGTYSALSAFGLPTVAKLPALPEKLQGVSSCLIISPQPPNTLFSERALGLVEVPTLVMTGTKDVRLDGEGSYTERVSVYDHLPTDLRQLAVFDQVEHMDFAGIGLGISARLSAIAGVTGEWWESTFWGDTTQTERATRLAQAGGADVPGEYR